MACTGRDGSKRRALSVHLDVRLEEAPPETFVDALALLAEHYFKQDMSPKGEASSLLDDSMETRELHPRSTPNT